MRWILASASPRREALLRPYIQELEIIPSEVEENPNGNWTPDVLVMSFAYQKAWDVANKISDHGIVIAADTVVYHKEIMMKPRSEEEARKMLTQLSGQVHEVYTGIAIIEIGTGKKIIDYEKTLVHFRHLDEAFITRYIETKEPLDKAGAYGIQGMGSLFVKKIEGSYDNVVGMPLSKLHVLMERTFGHSFV